jgi:hypothetical protein
MSLGVVPIVSLGSVFFWGGGATSEEKTFLITNPCGDFNNLTSNLVDSSVHGYIFALTF